MYQHAVPRATELTLQLYKKVGEGSFQRLAWAKARTQLSERRENARTASGFVKGSKCTTGAGLAKPRGFFMKKPP